MAWDQTRALEIIAQHRHREGATLPILHALQEAFGCVPEDAEPLIAEALNLTRAEVHGVVSFYRDFRRAPPGRHTLKLCRAEACQAMGGEALAKKVRARCANRGDTTPDGVTVEDVYCLGLCACAPAALADGRPLGRLDETRLDALLESLR